MIINSMLLCEYLSVMLSIICSCVLVYGQSSDLTSGAKMKKILSHIETGHYLPYPLKMTLEPWSTPPKFTPNAIFTIGLAATYLPKEVTHFAGTARTVAKFKGDIVLGLLPGSYNSRYKQRLIDFNVTVYAIDTKCSGKSDIRCEYNGQNDIPVTLLRHYIYQNWASKYPASSVIMLSDYRDVFFQSDPFKSRAVQLMPKTYQLTVFQEHHPNRVINRCAQNAGFIISCYGREVYQWLGWRTISTAGVVFGTRDGILAYSFLITQSANPSFRSSANATSALSIIENKHCYSFGVEQGFHNYLLYSNTLQKYMNVNLFQQGEGPANSLGGFFGDSKILKALLSEWKVLRGESPYKYVYNWNGELSPVVHQLDRFL